MRAWRGARFRHALPVAGPRHTIPRAVAATGVACHPWAYAPAVVTSGWSGGGCSTRLSLGWPTVRDHGADVPRIEAYAGELNQVWTNLVDNAVDAMDGQGTLRVATRAEGDEVVVEIGDPGPGMAPAVAARGSRRSTRRRTWVGAPAWASTPRGASSWNATEAR